MMSSAAVATTGATPPPAVSSGEGEKKSINPELWQACAGPLVNLPAAGTHVVYFPQGHSEQVAASMKKGIDAKIPNYPDLSSKLLCLLHGVTLHADPDTDEVYAQMTLQPVPSFDQEALLRSDLSLKVNRPQPEFFCKTLTASDTSTHGGFSVPRRAAEKIFPSLDYSIQPPTQELTARDLHDNLWTFRHIYRGQPKRHLLTTGWSLFVSGKRLSAGDSVLFVRDKNHNLLLGLRRAIRQPANLSSSVLSSDSMHIGILAAAAHAAANNSPFTVFYNPRASPSEFVIPLAKYYNATCGQQISPGMRFRMLFETEESGTRRYMGTVTGISELDSVRWKNSQWRNLQVGWDEAIAGERCNRVSAWEIEPVTAPFFICPPFFGAKRSRDDASELDSLFKRTMPWLGGDFLMKTSHALGGLSLAQRMSLHQNPCLVNPMQTNFSDSSPGFSLQGLPASDISSQLGMAAMPLIPQLQFNMPKQTQPSQQLDQQPDTLQTRQNMINQSQVLAHGQVQSHVLRSPTIVQTPNSLDNASSLQNNQLQRRANQIPPQKQQQQPVFHESCQTSVIASQLSKQSDRVTGNQIQRELCKFEQHQQSQLSQQSSQLQDTCSPNERQSLCSWVAEMQQVLVTTPQSQNSAHQINKNDAENTRVLPNLPQPANLQQQQKPPGLRSEGHGHVISISNHPCIAGSDNSITTAVAVAQPAIISNLPSFSTSPSNVQTITNMGPQTNGFGDGMALSSIAASSANNLEATATNGDTFKDLHQRSDIIMPSVSVSKPSNQDLVGQHFYQNVPGSHLDYLDTSSVTSASLSQGNAHLKRHNSSSFNSQSTLWRDTYHGEEVLAATTLASDPGNTDFSNISSGGFITSYENGKDVQQDPSSSMVTQSLGVPDMALNSIDSAMSGGQFLNQDAWGQPPAYQRMRTYTKVYKRGAVGRSIDVTSYSGYEELKRDLARRFGIEGQLEDRGRVGWKLVYVDHENDVLLLGDDPWEEFVRFVRCIKILSPQEVQRMSLDADYGGG